MQTRLTFAIGKSIIKATRLVAILAILCTAAGCAMRGSQPVPPPVRLPPTPQAAEPAPAAPAPPEAARAPIPTRPGGLSIHADCNARNETGYIESIKLAVNGGQVDLLEAKINIPRHGSCQFDLADFRQTRTAPHVELQSHSGTACTVRMWEQGDRFTVAFSDCQDKCTRGAFDYVWPVELDSKTGTCL